MQPVLRGALREPRRVVPLMLVDIDDDGSIVGALFGREAVRIGFQSPIASPRLNFEFVQRAFVEARDEKFPDSRLAAYPHRMNAAVPEIKVADDADAQRVGRPHAEVNAANASHFAHVRSELFIFLVMRAFTGKVEIVIGEQRRESVSVKRVEQIAIRESGIEAVRSRRDFLVFAQLADITRNHGLKHAARMNFLCCNRGVPSCRIAQPFDGHLTRCRMRGADRQDSLSAAVEPMGPEKLERVRGFGANDALDLALARVERLNGCFGLGMSYGHGRTHLVPGQGEVLVEEKWTGSGWILHGLGGPFAAY